MAIKAKCPYNLQFENSFDTSYAMNCATVLSGVPSWSSGRAHKTFPRCSLSHSQTVSFLNSTVQTLYLVVWNSTIQSLLTHSISWFGRKTRVRRHLSTISSSYSVPQNISLSVYLFIEIVYIILLIQDPAVHVVY